MIQLLKILLVLSILPSSSYGFAVGEKPLEKDKYLEEAMIQLQDDVSDACWTNLKEVREYAEEKLKIKGIRHVDTSYNQIYVYALGERYAGLCHVSIIVGLYSFIELFDGRYRPIIAKQRTKLLAHPSNANQGIIEAVRQLFDE